MLDELRVYVKSMRGVPVNAAQAQTAVAAKPVVR
jgi:hypothetical protein